MAEIKINIKDVINYCWCPKYYKLKKNDPNGANLKEAYDVAIHKCFYSYLVSLQNDEMKNSIDILKRRWGKEWVKQKSNSQLICTPSAFKRDTYDSKRKAGIDAIFSFDEIIAKESQFPIIINRQYEIKITNNITLVGTWEYVREVDKNGKSIIQLVKFKTDNNRFQIKHQTMHDLELTAAALAFEKTFNNNSFELLYFDIYKKKIIVSYRNSKDYQMLIKTVKSVVACLEQDIECISPNKQCYHCEYRDICSENF